MQAPDPVTPLTPAELAFVDTINANWTREQVLGRLKTDLQTAIEIELATIPIYLYTYYSLVRNNVSGEVIGDAQLFANKAGGVIMSVAVEEMLHMSLSSNVLFAMGVAPQLYQKAPSAYPTGLPYHNPKGPVGPGGKTAVQIPLAKLGFEQLWHFLQIEYPEQWNAAPQDSNWDTIGQFYSYIRCLLSTRFLTDADFQLGAAFHCSGSSRTTTRRTTSTPSTPTPASIPGRPHRRRRSRAGPIRCRARRPRRSTLTMPTAMPV
jgi:hypothetical protein